MKREEKIATEAVSKAIAEARRLAPKIEEALTAVTDVGMRASMGAALLGQLLGFAGPRVETEKARGRRTGRRPSQGGNVPSGGVGLVGTQARIMELAEEGFFAEPHGVGAVQNELRIRGYHHNRVDVRMSLLRLARKKLIRRVQMQEGKVSILGYVRT